jgi:MOSC domain-containing protein YiiM
LPWGIFGENLTTEGVLESEIAVGDRLRIGSGEFVVTQPRQPCFKLGIRFGDDRMLTRFLESGRSGFYLSIARTGALAAGDAIEWVAREPHHVTIADAVAIKAGKKASDAALLRRALDVRRCQRAGRTTSERNCS